jgi:hypothetical protein
MNSFANLSVLSGERRKKSSTAKDAKERRGKRQRVDGGQLCGEKR